MVTLENWDDGGELSRFAYLHVSEIFPVAVVRRGGPVAPLPVEPNPATSAGPRPLDLQGIFVMFATSALMGLGEAADPATRERRIDLEQAREAIDVLLLLRDKTSGNRTEQEDQLLEELVYDLQMRFVRVVEAQRSR